MIKSLSCALSIMVLTCSFEAWAAQPAAVGVEWDGAKPGSANAMIGAAAASQSQVPTVDGTPLFSGSPTSQWLWLDGEQWRRCDAPWETVRKDEKDRNKGIRQFRDSAGRAWKMLPVDHYMGYGRYLRTLYVGLNGRWHELYSEGDLRTPWQKDWIEGIWNHIPTKDIALDSDHIGIFITRDGKEFVQTNPDHYRVRAADLERFRGQSLRDAAWVVRDDHNYGPVYTFKLNPAKGLTLEAAEEALPHPGNSWLDDPALRVAAFQWLKSKDSLKDGPFEVSFLSYPVLRDTKRDWRAVSLVTKPGQDSMTFEDIFFWDLARLAQ